jgi:tetratricopeptide (TPR) repeat protein
MFTALHDSSSLASCYTILGDIDNAEGRHAEAIRRCTVALRMFEASKKTAEQLAACKCLYIAHKGLGRYRAALRYHEQLVMLDDSLKQDDVRLAVERMTFRSRLQADSLAREEEKTRLQLAHVQELGRRNRMTTIMLTGSLIILLLALFFLGMMLYFQRNAERLKTRTRELEKQQLINEISLLRTQVNPHFLFNSLSILSSLVRVDPGLSERFIDQLAKSYRYILEQSEQPLVTLRTELGFIESYAFLLRIRFENKFNLDIRIPDDMLDKYKIAPLTLQLLIENAVKHNRMSVQEPLVVHVGVNAEGMLEVSNKLQPRTSSSPSTGIGLRNIQNRYGLLTRQPVIAGETAGTFVVQIPLLSDHTADA